VILAIAIVIIIMPAVSATALSPGRSHASTLRSVVLFADWFHEYLEWFYLTFR
jgi:hypothetical protein